MYYLQLISWSHLVNPKPNMVFVMLWWCIGFFVVLIVIAVILRIIARRQKHDRALKLQLRGMGIGLMLWSLGGLILTWLRWEAIPWLGTPIIVPIYILLIVVWIVYSWRQFHLYHRVFLQKIEMREERFKYLPRKKKKSGR